MSEKSYRGNPLKPLKSIGMCLLGSKLRLWLKDVWIEWKLTEIIFRWDFLPETVGLWFLKQKTDLKHHSRQKHAPWSQGHIGSVILVPKKVTSLYIPKKVWERACKYTCGKMNVASVKMLPQVKTGAFRLGTTSCVFASFLLQLFHGFCASTLDFRTQSGAKSTSFFILGRKTDQQ